MTLTRHIAAIGISAATTSPLIIAYLVDIDTGVLWGICTLIFLLILNIDKGN